MECGIVRKTTASWGNLSLPLARPASTAARHALSAQRRDRGFVFPVAGGRRTGRFSRFAVVAIRVTHPDRSRR